jgi:8-oxo-dGTP pyrophosphatase MutT (NUDIX family)
MSRVDYIDDPAAPAANSVVPSAVACVVDEEGRVLMIHKTDNDLWALPGGAHELGETIADTVRREVAEETGYTIEVLALTGTYTNPKHVMAYDDGEVRQQFSLCLLARVLRGRPRLSSESKEVAWVAPEEIEGLPLHPSMRRRIVDALSGGDVHIS